MSAAAFTRQSGNALVTLRSGATAWLDTRVVMANTGVLAATRTPNVVTLLDFGFDAYFRCLDAGNECPDLLAEAVARGYWKWTSTRAGLSMTVPSRTCQMTRWMATGAARGPSRLATDVLDRCGKAVRDARPG